MQAEIEKLKLCHTCDANQLDSTCQSLSSFAESHYLVTACMCARVRLHDRYSEKDIFLRERGRQCNPTAWSPVKLLKSATGWLKAG